MAGLSNGWVEPEQSSEEQTLDESVTGTGHEADAEQMFGSLNVDVDSDPDMLEEIPGDGPQSVEPVLMMAIPLTRIDTGPSVPAAPGPEPAPTPVAGATHPTDPGPSGPRVRRTARKRVSRGARAIPVAEPPQSLIEQRLRLQLEAYERDLRDREQMTFNHSREATRLRRQVYHWEYAARRIAGNYRMAFLTISQQLSHLREEPRPTAAQVAALSDYTDQCLDDAKEFETSAFNWVRGVANE